MISNRNQNFKKFILFCLGGALNTGATYILFLVLTNSMDYQYAYFISYFTGIVLAYWFNTILVFNKAMPWKWIAPYSLIYIFQYCLSAFLLKIAVEYMQISLIIAPLLITTLIFPLTYLLNKLFIHKLSPQYEKKINC